MFAPPRGVGSVLENSQQEPHAKGQGVEEIGSHRSTAEESMDTSSKIRRVDRRVMQREVEEEEEEEEEERDELHEEEEEEAQGVKSLHDGDWEEQDWFESDSNKSDSDTGVDWDAVNTFTGRSNASFRVLVPALATHTPILPQLSSEKKNLTKADSCLQCRGRNIQCQVEYRNGERVGKACIPCRVVKRGCSLKPSGEQNPTPLNKTQKGKGALKTKRKVGLNEEMTARPPKKSRSSLEENDDYQQLQSRLSKVERELKSILGGNDGNDQNQRNYDDILSRVERLERLETRATTANIDERVDKMEKAAQRHTEKLTNRLEECEQQLQKARASIGKRENLIQDLKKRLAECERVNNETTFVATAANNRSIQNTSEISNLMASDEAKHKDLARVWEYLEKGWKDLLKETLKEAVLKSTSEATKGLKTEIDQLMSNVKEQSNAIASVKRFCETHWGETRDTRVPALGPPPPTSACLPRTSSQRAEQSRTISHPVSHSVVSSQAIHAPSSTQHTSMELYSSSFDTPASAERDSSAALVLKHPTPTSIVTPRSSLEAADDADISAASTSAEAIAVFCELLHVLGTLIANPDATSPATSSQASSLEALPPSYFVLEGPANEPIDFDMDDWITGMGLRQLLTGDFTKQHSNVPDAAAQSEPLVEKSAANGDLEDDESRDVVSELPPAMPAKQGKKLYRQSPTPVRVSARLQRKQPGDESR